MTPDELEHPDRPAAMNERRSASSTGEAPHAHEPRWPVALTVLGLLVMLIEMPERLRLLPEWVLLLASAFVVAPLVAVATHPDSPTWRKLERIATFAFVAFAAVGDLWVLRTLIVDILRDTKEVSGLELLASSVAIWMANVVTFSLLYWQLDRGGPTGRESASPCRGDWLFPHDQLGEEFLKPGWKPVFVDYLYLSFSTATAFSTTDAPPLTSRAKLAMMAQSAISLLTLVVVAARAINVLS